MLNDYTHCPKTLFREYLEKGYEEMEPMIAYSCNECSQCTLKCPKEFDLRSNFMAIKEAYAADHKGIVPLPVLQDSDAAQEKECAEEYCTTVDAAPKKKKEKRRSGREKRSEKENKIRLCSGMYSPSLYTGRRRKSCKTSERFIRR